jgi:Matrixin
MTSLLRVAVLLATAAVLAGAAPVSARPQALADATLAATAPTAISSSPAPCSDSKYNLIGPKWKQTLRWSYKSSTTPSYLTTAAAVQVLKRAFNNVTLERNDCGRVDTVNATWDYVGTTAHGIGVTKFGTCGSADGANTIGFGALPVGYLALTCVRSVGTSIVEADIRLGSGVSWALALGSCLNDFMLEAVATHEIGHAYGLAHVTETNHGRLTMSTFIDGPCENQESTLGLGDMKGLEALY